MATQLSTQRVLVIWNEYPCLSHFQAINFDMILLHYSDLRVHFKLHQTLSEHNLCKAIEYSQHTI